VVVAVVLSGQGQVGFGHFHGRVTEQTLQGIGLASISQEVDGESVAEAVDVGVGDATSAFSETTDEVEVCHG
jgi:hypothetical protein